MSYKSHISHNMSLKRKAVGNDDCKRFESLKNYYAYVKDHGVVVILQRPGQCRERLYGLSRLCQMMFESSCSSDGLHYLQYCLC